MGRAWGIIVLLVILVALAFVFWPVVRGRMRRRGTHHRHNGFF